MTAPHGVEWRRGFPGRAAALLAWYLAASAAGLAVVWLLFGGEPRRLGEGERNPLALVPPLAAALAAGGLVPLLVAVLRRPLLAADHFALRVRPGHGRTLLLPWARVAEVAAYDLGGEEYLLVRCRDSLDRLGDEPGWLDRGVLRAAVGDAGIRRRTVAGYDVALRLSDFAGPSGPLLAALAGYVPDHVAVLSELR